MTDRVCPEQIVEVAPDPFAFGESRELLDLVARAPQLAVLALYHAVMDTGHADQQHEDQHAEHGRGPDRRIAAAATVSRIASETPATGGAARGAGRRPRT